MKGTWLLKLAAWALALILVALPLIGLLNGWFAADRWPLRYVKIDAEFNHVSAEQIRATAVSHLNGGFFAVNLDEVQQAVAALPWVEAAEARKHWPDTIELHVVERQPMARWNSDRLISRSGQLFAVPGADVVQGLPQLSGPDRELSAVVEFYTRTQKEFTGTGYNVVGVDLSERGSWRIHLSNEAEIWLGREATEQRLKRFLDVMPRLTSGYAGFERVDLRYSNGFAIKWLSVLPAQKRSLAKVSTSGAVET